MNNYKQKFSSGRLVVSLSVVLLLLVAACTTTTGQNAATDTSEYIIELSEVGLTVPEQLPSGLVSIIFKNTGQAVHLPEIARLNEGVTLEEVATAASGEDPFAALALLQLLGGTQLTSGASQEIVYNLQEGTHLVIDFASDGPPVTAPFEATGESDMVAVPEADVKVDLNDFTFVMPDQLKAGSQTWQFSNNGNQWHEMLVVKLEDGMGLNDLLAMMQQESESDGPPPFEFAAFMAPLNQGEQTWTTFDLLPGEYALMCSLPDLAGGSEKSHAELGMVRQLTVTE